jgi:acetoacetyl-CoA synthetase
VQSAVDERSVLWRPSQARIEQAQITEFARRLSKRLGRDLTCDYRTLHQATIDQAADFWRELFDYCELYGSLGSIDYQAGTSIREGKWFPEGRLNMAVQSLKPERLAEVGYANSIAMVACDESGKQVQWTRQQLMDQVRRLARYLYRSGLRAGDRVAAVVPNVGEAVIAMLATTALGGVWSSCSPEFGDDAICDRFGQIKPAFLLTSAKAIYNQKEIKPLATVQRILPRLPSVKQVVVVGLDSAEVADPCDSCWVDWQVASGECQLSPALEAEFASEFLKPQPFNHPVYIVYSSGTTGVPKCIVHGVGGTVLQHAKEHRLHCDLKLGDVLLYYTTTGWMMWNWLVSAMAADATIVLQDGSPFARGNSTLWETAAALRVTHFGAGARYYTTLEKQQYQPRSHFDLSALSCVMSTGSPLPAGTFDWIYQSVSQDINLASISGGTDILSCFVLGNPTLPVRRGEIQCKGLGMDVRVLDSTGKALVNQPGELVCVNPFPSMPIGFWNDPDGRKYQAAYFDAFENVWCHGDWCEETESGGMVIYGRSDATLNPGGVRLGTGEIYQQLDAFSEIAESLATTIRTADDEQIVLFIRLAAGYDLTEDLVQRIRQRIRNRCSARHVPKFIDFAPDFPRTISGKLSEIAVRNAISGTRLGNEGSLANPQSLEYFQHWKPTERG